MNRSEHELKLQLEKLDELTKQIQRQAVLTLLAQEIESGIPEKFLSAYAQIANRNHDQMKAMKILYTAVKTAREQGLPASPEVLVVYANSLRAIGALEEADRCLNGIKGNSDAFLARALIGFNRWDYDGAIPHLEKYIKANSRDPYKQLVGEVNLAACLVASGKLPLALEILSSLLDKLKDDPSRSLLFGNCLELQAQVYIQQKQEKLARSSLEKAQMALKDQPGRYLLYVEKWLAVLDLMFLPNPAAGLAAINKVKANAHNLRNWETIRDCDFHIARVLKDEELFKRVWWGTPYRNFRQRILEVYGERAPLARDFQFCPGNTSENPNSIGLDLSLPPRSLVFQPTLAKLVQLMTSDIYRPPRMGQIFSELYPNEYFNPFSSPERVRNTVFRFNEWAKQEQNPFRIQIEKGDFIFSGPRGAGISCVNQARLKQPWEQALNIFKASHKGRSFNCADFAKVLNLSKNAAMKILNQGLKKNKIQKQGKGRAVRYMFFSGNSRLNENQKKIA